MFITAMKILLATITMSMSSVLLMANYEKIATVFNLPINPIQVEQQDIHKNKEKKVIPVVAGIEINEINEVKNVRKMLEIKKREIKTKKLSASNHRNQIFTKIEEKRNKIKNKKRVKNNNEKQNNIQVASNKTSVTKISTVANNKITDYEINNQSVSVKDLIPAGSFSDQEIAEAENAINLMMSMKMDINVSEEDLEICFGQHDHNKCRELITQVLSDNFVR
tara:strand:- start:6186 stop:6851 length:666 start_codon:yes stop_codon:yes gene_type:complete